MRYMALPRFDFIFIMLRLFSILSGHRVCVRFSYRVATIKSNLMRIYLIDTRERETIMLQRSLYAK